MLMLIPWLTLWLLAEARSVRGVPPAAKGLYASTFTALHLALLRNETKTLFDFAWNSYLDHGFPSDEVAPLSCQPMDRDYDNENNLYRNDVMGNYSVMLFDNLDTFVVMGDVAGWQHALGLVRETYPNFDLNSTIQVFETTIRVLGGLLSAHLFAADPSTAFAIAGYDGFLLDLAHDLGSRLFPAYTSAAPGGVPYPRINLRHGLSRYVSPANQHDNCAAGSTLILEFGMLSKLTGDPRFLEHSMRAVHNLWDKRSPLGLVAASYDPNTGRILNGMTGIGASIDSFYEYLLKYAVVFGPGDPHHAAVHTMWSDSYAALATHSRTDWLYTTINATDGNRLTAWVDALMAFWPGLQVLNGNVEDAERFNLLYLKLWNTYGAIPERWYFERVWDRVTGPGVPFDPISLEWYPLRPEFVESCYHLYRATKDPLYLQIGQRVLQDFREVFIAPCGFAGYQNIKTGQRADRMETFALSETLKYLYLLFDEANLLHSHRFTSGKSMVYSTEAHPLWYDKTMDPNHNPLLKRYGNAPLGGATSRRHTPLEPMYAPRVHAMPDAERLGFALAVGPLAGGRIRPQCEVPLSAGVAAFTASRLLSRPDFYRIDDWYRETLRKPSSYQNLTVSLQTETQPAFYRIFGPHAGAMSLRSQTTKEYVLVVGPLNRAPQHLFLQVVAEEIGMPPTQGEAATLEAYGGVVLPGDWWMPWLAGSHMQLEVLGAGEVDASNRLVTHEIIEGLYATKRDGMCLADPNAPNVWPSALHLRLVNGISLKPDAVVWTLPFDDEEEIRTGTDGTIYLQGLPVENMRVWYGVPLG